MESAKERMERAGEVYELVAKDNEELRKIVVFMKEAAARLEPLSEYYFETWLEDMEELEAKGYQHPIMNEDAVYNEIADQYELMKQILLVAAKYINGERSI